MSLRRKVQRAPTSLMWLTYGKEKVQSSCTGFFSLKLFFLEQPLDV